MYCSGSEPILACTRQQSLASSQKHTKATRSGYHFLSLHVAISLLLMFSRDDGGSSPSKILRRLDSRRLLQVLGDTSINYIRNVPHGLDLASLVSALLTCGIACRTILISGPSQVS